MGQKAQKFLDDIIFFIVCHFVVGASSILCAVFSVSADNGGTFPIPYQYTGFILGLLNFLSVAAKLTVVIRVWKRPTKKKLLKAVQKRRCGRLLWPITSQIGFLYCVISVFIIGFGGLNCKYDEIEKNNGTITYDADTFKNNCYYDILGEDAKVYRGCAIGLLIAHLISGAGFIITHNPQQHVSDVVEDDPPNANSRDSSASSSGSARRLRTTNNQLQLRVTSLESELRTLREQARTMESREYELSVMESEIAAHRQANAPATPPPSYNTLSRTGTRQNLNTSNTIAQTPVETISGSIRLPEYPHRT